MLVMLTASLVSAQAPVAAIGYAGNTTGCSPVCAVFSDNSTGNPTSWQWFFIGGSPSFSTLQNPGGVCFSDTGYHDVILLVSNGNGSDSTGLSIFHVTESPISPVITQHSDTLLCSVDPSYVHYQWYDNVTPLPNDTNPILIITHSGNYNVAVTNKYGCQTAVGISINGNPQADFSTQVPNICQNSCISFTNTSTQATSYQWFFPGATPSASTAINPSNICYLTPGTYSVTLIATGPLGTDTMTKGNYINVGASPVMNASASSPSICWGSIDTLYVSGAMTYSWAPGSSLSSTMTASTLASPDFTTTYTVTGVSFMGCVATASVTVTVTSPPVITNSDTIICEGNFAYLNASGGTSYSWHPATSLNSDSIANPIAIPSTTTTYSVTAINGSCSATVEVTVSVIPAPATPTITQAGDTLYCSHDSSFYSYQWYLNNVAIPGATDSVYVFTQKGTYHVAVSNYLGCSVAVGYTVVCSHILINGQVTKQTCPGCNDGSISNVSVFGATSPLSYAWSTGETTSSITGLPAGSYSLALIDSAGCMAVDSFYVDCCLNMGCSAYFYIYPDSLIAHHYYLVSGSTGIAPLQYLWSWGDGSYDTIPYPTHNYASPGFFPVCLRITDVTNCVDSMCHTFELLRTAGGGTPVSMTVVNPVVTGKPNVESHDAWSLYPNPAGRELSIQLLQSFASENVTVSIMNILGQKAMSASIPKKGEKVTLDISSLSSGVYFIEIKAENETHVARFVKE